MKKNRILWFFLAVLIAFSASGCFHRDIKGNGNVISQERPCEGFNGLAITGAAVLNVHFSESYKVVVTTDSNIQEIIETKTFNNLLEISERRSDRFSPTKFAIDVYMPELTNITLTGAGKITIDEGKTSGLKIKITGAGKIDAQNYEAQIVDIDLSGAGEVKTWASSALNYNISGFGNIRFKGSPALNGKIGGLGKVSPM